MFLSLTNQRIITATTATTTTTIDAAAAAFGPLQPM